MGIRESDTEGNTEMTQMTCCGRVYEDVPSSMDHRCARVGEDWIEMSNHATGDNNRPEIINIVDVNGSKISYEFEDNPGTVYRNTLSELRMFAIPLNRF